MSRSYKKNKVIKYGKWLPLKLANRKVRRVNKIRVKLGKRPLDNKELINPYNICDNIWKLVQSRVNVLGEYTENEIRKIFKK